MCYYEDDSVNHMPVNSLVFKGVEYYARTNACTVTALTSMWMSEFFKAYKGKELWIPNLIWRENRPNTIQTEHTSCNPHYKYFRHWCVFTPKNGTTVISAYNAQVLDCMVNLDLEVSDEEMFTLSEDPRFVDLIFVPCRAKNKTTEIPLGFLYKGQNDDGSLNLSPMMSQYADVYEHFDIVTKYPLDLFKDQLHETIFDIDYGSIECETSGMSDYELLDNLKFHLYTKHIRVEAYHIYGLNMKTIKSNPVLD